MELYLGEYYKLRSLGEGSFADVYLVRHHTLDYIRALKVSKDNIDDVADKKWQKFMKECRLLLKIGNGGHPNIIKIYQPRLIQQRAVVEMDYVEGETLQSYIEQHQFLPFKEVWKFIKDIIGAMAYCHVDVYRYLMDPKEDGLELNPLDGRKYKISKEKENELVEKYGVCHNDLHSKNIMRRDLDDSYILLDFGLAIQNRQAVNSSKIDEGAVEYSAPEKFNHLEPTIRSDIYSLGVLLFKVLTGVVPFPLKSNSVESISNVWEAKRNQKPPQIFTLRKQAFERVHSDLNYTRDYPEAFDNIIAKCLAVDPEDRYKNAKELLLALEEAYSSFDELSRLDNANVKLSNQLSLAYSRIDEAESSVIQSKKQLEEKDRIIESAGKEIKAEKEACITATNKAVKWKRRAIILPIAASVILGTIAVFAGNNTQSNNSITSSAPDTIRVEVPSDAVTKIEYRTPPEVQKELNELRSRNDKLKTENNGLRTKSNDLQGENKRLREVIDELNKSIQNRGVIQR